MAPLDLVFFCYNNNNNNVTLYYKQALLSTLISALALEALIFNSFQQWMKPKS